MSTSQPIPEGAKEVGRWHTHGRYTGPSDEEFSEEDLRLVWRQRLPRWLGTPKGAIKKAVVWKSGVVSLEIDPIGTRPNIKFTPMK